MLVRELANGKAHIGMAMCSDEHDDVPWAIRRLLLRVPAPELVPTPQFLRPPTCTCTPACEGFALNVQDFGVSMGTPVGEAENIAYVSLGLKFISYATIAHLCNNLPNDGRKRMCHKKPRLEGMSFTSGAYSLGGLVGVRGNSRKYPWTSLLLTTIVRSVCPTAHFSSTVLIRNIKADMHVDKNNDASSFNTAVPCSTFSGGEIWIQDGYGEEPFDNRAGAPLGTRLPIVKPCVHFNAHMPHGTCAWQGDRIVYYE